MSAIGITQGRLVSSEALQRFPQQEWRQEMHTAGLLGFSHVEWLVEREMNPANPIWSPSGCREILQAAAEASLPMYSVVYDYMIDHDLAGADDALKQLLVLIERAQLLGVRMIVVPLFEASEPVADDYGRYVPPLQTVAAAALGAGIEVVLESVLPAETLLRMADALGHRNVGVCFDSGNRAAQGFDICADLKALGALVRHVHVKDKSASGQNVLLGTGIVDFRRFFHTLAGLGFDRRYTLETARGDDPVATGRRHLQFVDGLMTKDIHA